MQIINHVPVYRFFVNGFQITFPNKYTIIAKYGPGTNSTQLNSEASIEDFILNKRTGTYTGPDIEVEVYDPKNQNISKSFTLKNTNSCESINPLEFVNLLYIVSSLK